MTAYTNLVGSDTLFFRSLEYDRTGPSFGPFTPGHKTFSNICVRKVAGQLSFKLNTVRHLNIQQPFDFDVEFVAPLSSVGDDPSSLRWEVKQLIDREFDVGSGLKIHIAWVTGGVTTILRPRNRLVAKDCASARRSICVDLESDVGSVNAVYVSAYIGKGGAAVLPEVSMRNITLLADGRDQFVMGGQINASMDECSIFAAVPGGVQEFWAQVANVPADEIPTFKWSIAQGTDATIVPQPNPRHLRVKLGSKPDPFTVSVALALAGGDSLKLERVHRPETAESVAEKRRLCKLRHLARLLGQPNMFWDPLWDPLRDKPMTRRELQRLGRLANAFEAEIGAILDARLSASRTAKTSKSTCPPRRRSKD